MHLLHIPQCSIQNRYVHISVLNGALWDMKQVHSGIFQIGIAQGILTSRLPHMGIQPVSIAPGRVEYSDSNTRAVSV